MLDCFTTVKPDTIKIIPVCTPSFSQWLQMQPEGLQNLVRNQRFTAVAGSYCLSFDLEGNLNFVLLGMQSYDDFLSFGVLPTVLPAGSYQVVSEAGFTVQQLQQAAIGWGMGWYRFTAYKKSSARAVYFCGLNEQQQAAVDAVLRAKFLVRDLINQPASAMTPECLANVAKGIAKRYGGKLKIYSGKNLMQGFPAVHAVGMGSEHEPLLIELQFGRESYPKVALVGKGVCFDSGGLQLKPLSSMLQMKKDMAGAAHALAVAQLIMEQQLPLNLRVIIPAVENLPSGHSLKTGDIICARSGKMIEVDNTDAEGRLILADALTYASEWHPEIIFDFATLTGASRTALGLEITALFSNRDEIAEQLIPCLTKAAEPTWRLPLYQPYLRHLKSPIADLKNIARSNGVGGGAILGGLFLEQFVGEGLAWVHFDMNAYNDTPQIARPEGGEACCVVGVVDYLKQRFGSSS